MTISPPLRTAIAGYGYWGVNQARNIAASPNTDLVYVIERDAARRAQAASQHPSARCVPDLDAVDEDLEAIVIATPAGDHAELGERALRRGLHVLVEKPLAMSASEASALVELADDVGLKLMVGHTFLYSSPVRHLRSIIAEGELGDIQYLAFQRLSLGTIRGDCDVMWNLAPHDISIAAYLLDDLPMEVTATGYSFIQPPIADVVFGTMSFGNGVGVGLHLSWLDPLKTRRLTVVGTKRMAVYDDVSVDRKIEVFDSGVVDPRVGMGESSSMAEWQWKTRAGDIVARRIPLWEPLRLQIDSFAGLVRDDEPVPTDGAHGVAVVRVLEALSASIASGGRAVKVEDASARS